MHKILLLEDNSTDAKLVSRELLIRWPKLELKVASRIEEARKWIEVDSDIELALFDIKLPDGSGLDLLIELRNEQCSLPVIILTGTGTEELATSALKSGANDYIVKKAGYHKHIPKQIEFTLKQVLANRQDLSVLYAERHKSDVDLTSHYLKKYAPHIHLTIASSGEEVLKLLPTNNEDLQYDVLLLDYRLQGLNALEISKQILLERGLSIAIVIVTGQGDENVAVEALKIGVDDYIVKRENYLVRLPSVLTSAFRRKEMERQQLALKASETKFRLLADYAADWEYWIDTEGEYIYISPICEEISGYPPKAFKKNKDLLFEITHPDYQTHFSKHLDSKDSSPHKTIEFPIITANGSEKWISHSCRPVYDDNQIYAGQRGVNRDITERRSADLELRQSEDRFKRLFEDLGDAVYVTRTGKKNMGQILEANSAAVRQSGFSKKELLKMNIIKDLVVSGSGNINTKEWDLNLREGKVVTTIEEKRKKDNTKYWTEVTVTPIEYKGELASLSINRDITERRRAEITQQIILNISNASQTAPDLEEIMKTIQKELGRIIDTENFFIALYNEETNLIHLLYYQDEMDDVVEFPAGKTLTGMVIEEGKSLLIDKEETTQLEAEGKIDKASNTAAIWLGVPLKIKGKTTGAFVVQSYSNPKAYTEKDKDVLEIISHQISISIERKRYEENLLKALEAAKESDRMKTAFLANMSHELRTPLNAVIGFSDLIDEKTVPKEAAEFSLLINKSGINLLEIVDEIFEVTLLDRGQITLNRTPKPLSIFLNDIYQTILHRQKNLSTTGVIIKQDLSGIDMHTIAYTDFEKLKQILLNLLNNAVKFTHEGSISFGVSIAKNKKEFEFFVKDTGIGISEEQHATIFERFQIGDDTRTRIYSGVGVGLYISNKLVNILGGQIWLESEVDKGTTFYFTIPK